MARTYKTWEIWRDAEKLEGRAFKCVRSPFRVIGGQATLMEFAGNTYGLGIKTNAYRYTRIADLTGFEEWELMQEPVDFMTVVNSDKRIKPEGNYSYERLAYWLCEFPRMPLNSVLLLLNGKWYIEEAE